jgi:hypothetical protein
MENTNSTKKQVHAWGAALLLPLAVIILGIWGINYSEENRKKESTEVNSAFLKEVENTRTKVLREIEYSKTDLTEKIKKSEQIIIDTLIQSINNLDNKLSARLDSSDKKLDKLIVESKSQSTKVPVRQIKKTNTSTINRQTNTLARSSIVTVRNPNNFVTHQELFDSLRSGEERNNVRFNRINTLLTSNRSVLFSTIISEQRDSSRTPIQIQNIRSHPW